MTAAAKIEIRMYLLCLYMLIYAIYMLYYDHYKISRFAVPKGLKSLGTKYTTSKTCQIIKIEKNSLHNEIVKLSVVPVGIFLY